MQPPPLFIVAMITIVINGSDPQMTIIMNNCGHVKKKQNGSKSTTEALMRNGSKS